MSRPTELLDLYAFTLRPPRVDHVDGFDSLQGVIAYLKQHPDTERTYCVTDVGCNIRAVAFFTHDNLILLTSGGEVIKS